MWVYSTFEAQQYDTIGYPRKILQNKKNIFLVFYLSRNVAPKPIDQSCSNSIFRVLLQLSRARPFHFQPTLNIKDTLMLMVVHIKKQETE